MLGEALKVGRGHVDPGREVLPVRVGVEVCVRGCGWRCGCVGVGACMCACECACACVRAYVRVHPVCVWGGGGERLLA